MAPSVNWMRDEDVETGDFYNKMIIITHNNFMAKMQLNVNIPVPERKTRRNTTWRTSLFIAGF